MTNTDKTVSTERLVRDAFNGTCRAIGDPFWHELPAIEQWRLLRMFKAGATSRTQEPAEWQAEAACAEYKELLDREISEQAMSRILCAASITPPAQEPAAWQVKGLAWAKVRIDTQPDADGWCFCTPANHPQDIAEGKAEGDWNEGAQFHGQVRAATPPAPERSKGEVVEALRKARNTLDSIGGYSSVVARCDAALEPASLHKVEATLPERDTARPAEEQGLFHKFDVRRVDGSDAPGGKHHGCRYFVLDVDHDPHAVDALIAYANACEKTHPALATDLRDYWCIPTPPSPLPVTITPDMVLAGCLATHPALFRNGLEPLPGDGPATRATMAGVVKSVTAVLTAALSKPGEQ